MVTDSPFPLVRLPLRIAFVDDSPAWLQALQMHVVTGERRLFFDQSLTACQTLQREQVVWNRLRDLMHSYTWTDRSHLLAGVAANYFNQGARFRLSTVLMLDYAMPGLNGLELAERLQALECSKVLLTAEAGPGLAVGAFNQGLIHSYRPKARCREADAFDRIVQEMHLLTCRNFSNVLESGTSRAHVQLLRKPQVASALWAMAESLGWHEHVVIEHPFGVLGLPRNGKLQWVQIETPESMAALGGIGAMGASAATRLAARGNHIGACLGCPGLRTEWPETPLCADPPLWTSTWELPLPVLCSDAWGIESVANETQQARSLATQLAAAQRHQIRVHNTQVDDWAPLLQRARDAADDSLRMARAQIDQWGAQCSYASRVALHNAARAAGVPLDT